MKEDINLYTTKSNDKFYKDETVLEDTIQQYIEKFEDTLRDMIKKNDIKKIYKLEFKIKLIPILEMSSGE
jgi:hypothetical protein